MEANERTHRDWIGMAQPEGLVVTAAALKAAEANITSPVIELQAQLADLAGEAEVITDLPAFVRDIFGWSDEFVVAGADLPATLRVEIEGGEALVPTMALRSADDPNAFALLVMQVGAKTSFDTATDDKRWTATAHQRFERLLRDTAVHVGVLTNGKLVRLVYAPKGESAGWVTFAVADMLQVAGRDLLGAMHMLLNQARVLTLESFDPKTPNKPGLRLSDLLRASREYQNTVSNRLREQILSALRELLIGFQQADRLREGAILRDYRGEHMQEVYGGIVTVLMRMVFVLFAEERGLLPMEHDLYASGYSLSRLHAQLGDDRTRHGDTLNDRYGAWARVISLFRLLHDGVVAANGLRIPARKGDFFNPDKHPFLEGRPRGAARQLDAVLDLPRVSDGVLFRVLDQLLVLDGERLQYKGLDVEQIGSVYEGLMGFEIEVATGPSVCVTPEHVVVDLTALLALPGADRVKHLKAAANLDAKDKLAGEVRAAQSVEALHAALGRRLSSRQPGLITTGSLFLQPGEERRKSGSHYTPKSLTAPIVETALGPLLARLGPNVTPEQILDLKVCDPAMGSAAFLVEGCRQLADHLVAAWRRTSTMPELPPDEDPILHARRLIAQRCLYGVDKNPLAVELARLSMWLVTFAKEHPFTFVDHALRCGDSLVGVSREQIASLNLDVGGGLKQLPLTRKAVAEAVTRAEELRNQIHAIGDPPDNERLVELWRDANDALVTVRLLGDMVVASFFSAGSEKLRKRATEDLTAKVQLWLATGEHGAELREASEALRSGTHGVEPFHWEIEFPEVFGRTNAGFDSIVGNPPFIGGHKIWPTLGESYRDWVLTIFDGSTAKTDVVAHFFRRAFGLLRANGTLGLVATNSIAQGDSRKSGLQWICANGGTIFAARRRFRWPGTVSVVVSIVHIIRAKVSPVVVHLDEKPAARITAYLFHTGADEDPSVLRANDGLQFRGSMIYGQGFLFDDRDPAASSLAEMRTICEAEPRSSDRIFPFIGGEEVNTSPRHEPHRHVINFADMSLDEARRWPALLAVIEAKVLPERRKLGGYSVAEGRNARWWLFGTYAASLHRRAASMTRVLAASQVTPHWALAFLPSTYVFSHKLTIFALEQDSGFAVLQSNIHECWARFFSGTAMDLLRYTPTDCFETFPFPPAYVASPLLNSAGMAYYEHRAALMIANNEGMTKTYNRFHDPDEHSPAVQRLRDLHIELDRAVLDGYRWHDIRPAYEFREQLDEQVRLTWDDDTRDDVLARLLELNRVQAAREEADAKTHAPSGKAVKRSPRKKAGRSDAPMLPGLDGGEKPGK